MILRANGISSRHYALDEKQNCLEDVYDLGRNAVMDLLAKQEKSPVVTYLSAGSTNTPLVAPGIATILHDRLAENTNVFQKVEISSSAGVCSSGAQSIINAYRAIKTGEHKNALCVGAENPSAILKSSVISLIDDLNAHRDIRKSKWFMTVFLRSMLSDGAGAMMLSDQPRSKGLSLKFNWVYSQSFANEAPLCMSLEGKSLRLGQDLEVLNSYMKPCVQKFLSEAFESREDSIADYSIVLPHLSSFYFRSHLLDALETYSSGDSIPRYWTNLATKGNTGSASIFIILDEYLKSHEINNGEKILLFVPESGQFNFVMISLTVIKR